MFQRDASIVLLGVRGCGKTSLAIIAQASLGLQHIEADDAFHKETGVSAPHFRKQFGAQESRTRWLSFLAKLLSTYSKNCAIVWPKDYVEEAGLSLLKQYGKDHPVILVQRDTTAIEKYLQLPQPTKIERIMKLMIPAYRTCSNYEYFNLDETESLSQNGHSTDDFSKSFLDADHQAPRSLRLKRLEQSFLRLVKNIMQPDLLLDQDPDRPPLPQSRATYTYLLTVSVAQMSSGDFNMRWLDCGADAIQLEIESDMKDAQSSPALIKERISRAFATVTKIFNGPVIYHLIPASAELPGSFRSLYLDLLDHGFRLGVDFVTVQLGLTVQALKGLIKLSRGTRLIGDYHDSALWENGWTSLARRNILTKAVSLGFDGIRLTQPARSSSDNREAASFAVSANRGQNSRPFVIAYNTGPLGRTSRCFNEILTPITTEELRSHLSKSVGERNLLSEITIQQSQSSIYASFIYDPMKYYIIGLDVSYSYSPVVHNAAHEFFGMPHRLHIRSMSTLDGLSHLTGDENFGGLTIAQGFKMTLFSRVSAVSIHARNIGAINTLLPIRAAFDYTKPPPPEFWTNRNRAGPVLAFYGDNLDWIGITRCIKQNLSPANVITPNSTALVIGAGGMARAAIYALLNLGVQHIVLYNRTYRHARTLADHFSEVKLDTSLAHTSISNLQNGDNINPLTKRDVRVLDSLEADWCDDLAPPKTVVSCIPAPKTSERPQDQFLLPLQWMKSPTGGVVIDMNYRALITPLLRQVWGQAQRGWVAVDGLENLVEQASAQFEVFTCRKVPKNLMRIAALKHYLSSSKEDAEVCQYIASQLRRMQSKT